MASTPDDSGRYVVVCGSGDCLTERFDSETTAIEFADEHGRVWGHKPVEFDSQAFEEETA